MNGSLQAVGDGISFTQKLIQLHEGSIGGRSALVQDLASELREKGFRTFSQLLQLEFWFGGGDQPEKHSGNGGMDSRIQNRGPEKNANDYIQGDRSPAQRQGY